MTFILPSSSQRLGGKAAALRAAAEAGLTVPAWFVVSPDACAAERDPVAADRLRTEVAAALVRLCPGGEPVAVRSSAIEEDQASHAFAGQFESYLSVPHADVPARVADVFRSARSERVERYRRAHGLQDAGPPAVLVQRMVDADAAGIAFSVDPVSGDRDVVVVSAVRGLGAALAAGDVDGETFEVDRAGRVRRKSSPAVPGAVDDDRVRAIANLARAAERVFGRPQDIEWAYHERTLYLLQSRAITTPSFNVASDGLRRLWDNSNIVESYDGVVSPLTFSFAREAYAGVYRQFCRILRVPAATIAANEDLFANMLGRVRGRVYYNLLNWYRLLMLLPGFRANRRFMEQMMGVRESLADAGSPGATAPGRLFALVPAGVGVALGYLTLRRRTARFRARLEEALAPPDPPLAGQSADDLVASYRRLRAELLTGWDAPVLNDFFAMIFYGLLRDRARRWCGDADGTLQNDLLAGEGGLVSTEPAARIESLAALAAPHAAVVDALLTGEPGDILAAARQVPGFAAEYDAYLARFGERMVDELKLESPTLVDQPLPLLRALGRLARRRREAPDPTPRSDAAAVRAAAEDRVARALAGRPLRRALFRWILDNARARVRDRENLRFERTRVFGRVRRIFVELGRRLHGMGAIDDPRDVFALQIDEVLGFVEGWAVTTDLRALVSLRRADEDAWTAEAPPPSRFETRGPACRAAAWSTESATAGQPEPRGDEHRGVGCCPGIRRGTVTVIRDPTNAVLGPDAIVVAERTDPGWITLFPAITGLIVERGSVLSHSAIVARELGIPAIVSVPGVTAWLRDGDRVEINGSTGVVRKLAA